MTEQKLALDWISKALYCLRHGDTESVENYLLAAAPNEATDDNDRQGGWRRIIPVNASAPLLSDEDSISGPFSNEEIDELMVNYEPQSTMWNALAQAKLTNQQDAEIERLRGEVERLKEWENEVITNLICCHIYHEERHKIARCAVNELLGWTAQVAVDPRVSSDAAKLVADAKEQAEARVRSLEAALRIHGSHHRDCDPCADPHHSRLAEAERDAAVGKEWRENSSLEKWFPFTADFLERAKARSERANDLIDRALKMMQMAGYTVVAHNPDHANPIIGWMASAQEFLPPNYKRNPAIDAARSDTMPDAP